MKLKIGTKLISGFMSMVLLMLVIAAVAYWNLGKVAESADIVPYDKVPVADASMESMIAVISSRDLMGEYMLCEDVSKLPGIRAEYVETIEDFDMWLSGIKYGTDSGEFKAAEGGKVYAMWLKDGLDKEMVIKKGSDQMTRLVDEADAFHSKFQVETAKIMKYHEQALTERKLALTGADALAKVAMVKADEYSEQADLKMDEVEVEAGRDMDRAMDAADAAEAQAP